MASKTSRTRPRGGFDVWTIPDHAPSGTPAELDYDKAPKPKLTNAPVYPLDLLRANTKGKVTVTFAVDTHGFPHVMKVEGDTDKDFGPAAQAMVQSWRFEPASREGKPCWALLRKEQYFDRDAIDFPIGYSARRLLKDLDKNPCPILLSANTLDEKLAVRFQPGPDVSDAIRKEGKPCQAVIEFIVDHAGHAQLPRIVSASNPEFGWAAATAVARWQFNQPHKGGKPVDVFLRVPVAYRPENPAPKAP